MLEMDKVVAIIDKENREKAATLSEILPAFCKNIMALFFHFGGQ